MLCLLVKTNGKFIPAEDCRAMCQFLRQQHQLSLSAVGLSSSQQLITAGAFKREREREKEVGSGSRCGADIISDEPMGVELRKDSHVEST